MPWLQKKKKTLKKHCLIGRVIFTWNIASSFIHTNQWLKLTELYFERTEDGKSRTIKTPLPSPLCDFIQLCCIIKLIDFSYSGDAIKQYRIIAKTINKPCRKIKRSNLFPWITKDGKNRSLQHVFIKEKEYSSKLKTYFIISWVFC